MIFYFVQVVDQRKKNSGSNGGNAPTSAPVYAARSKSLGPRRTLKSPFVLPIKDQNKNDDNEGGANDSKNQSGNDSDKPVGIALLVYHLLSAVKLYFLNR